MKKLQCLALIAFTVFTTPVSHAKDYHVYFLGGQSNMVGLGRRADLDAKYHKPVDGVMIFHGRQGMDNRDTDRGEKDSGARFNRGMATGLPSPASGPRGRANGWWKVKCKRAILPKVPSAMHSECPRSDDFIERSR